MHACFSEYGHILNKKINLVYWMVFSFWQGSCSINIASINRGGQIMNSQLFQNSRCKTSSNAGALHTTLAVSPAIVWLSFVLLMMAIILFPERPAWGSDFDINIVQKASRDMLIGLKSSTDLKL
jgi:hypothetical protein